MYGLTVDHESSLSMQKQLQNQMREGILSGRIPAGDCLPSSRALATELGVSRNTVLGAYDQLIAEGYLRAIGGSGIYVASVGRLPEKSRESFSQVAAQPIVAMRHPISFDVSKGDRAAFPAARWSACLKNACRREFEEPGILHDPLGAPGLRDEIAAYLRRKKGIDCARERIVITSGAAGAMDLIARIFREGRRRIVVEDPCIHFVREIFGDYGYRVMTTRTDERGICAEPGNRIAAADLVYVSPSHQFPLGGILPVSRRVQLLTFAHAQDAYVIEDDYDSEFRYEGEPVPSLLGLDDRRVLYVGSFSKILSSSMRIGYVILPAEFAKRAAELIDNKNAYVNLTLQLAMEEFLRERYLDAHIYRMKKLYAHKRQTMIARIREIFGNSAAISGENAGLHLLLRYERALTDQDRVMLRNQGLEIEFVEDYAWTKGAHTHEMILGYGALSEREIADGLQTLCDVLARRT